MNESSFRKWTQFTWKRNGLNHEFHHDTETNRLLIANYFHQNILSTKYIKMNIFQRFGDYWLICFCGSLWTFCYCGVTITMLCNYYCECAAWIGWGLLNAVCHGWANSGPRAICDPTQRFQWPAEAFRKIFKSESSFNSYSKYSCWGYKPRLASTLIGRHGPPLNAAF